jgi:hypothetical protein
MISPFNISARSKLVSVLPTPVGPDRMSTLGSDMHEDNASELPRLFAAAIGTFEGAQIFVIK